MTWPAGMGLNFKGVLDLYADEFVDVRLERAHPGRQDAGVLPEDVFAKLEEEVELARGGPAALRRPTAIAKAI